MNGLLTLLSESLDGPLLGHHSAYALVGLASDRHHRVAAARDDGHHALSSDGDCREGGGPAPAPLADASRIGSLRKSPSERSPALSRSPRTRPIEETRERAVKRVPPLTGAGARRRRRAASLRRRVTIQREQAAPQPAYTGEAASINESLRSALKEGRRHPLEGTRHLAAAPAANQTDVPDQPYPFGSPATGMKP
jgi:hypothetical protein